MTFVAAFAEWKVESMLCFSARRPAEFWFLASCTGACFLIYMPSRKKMLDCSEVHTSRSERPMLAS